MMNILFDITCFMSEENAEMIALVRSMIADDSILLFIFCDTDKEASTIISDADLLALPQVNEYSDMNGFDFFISSVREKPECLKNAVWISSVAILLDFFRRIESIDDTVATNLEECRFWIRYDYCLSLINYIAYDEYALSLGLEKESFVHIETDSKFDAKDVQDLLLAERNLAATISSERCATGIIEALQTIYRQGENQPLVSIVTVTFNLIKNDRRDLMVRCIDSVRNQSYPHIEHLIIDGASADGTLEFLGEYEQKGWISIKSEPDEGFYDAMNKSMGVVQGKYIVFLNSDDYYCDNDAVRYAVRSLERSRADYAFGNALVIHDAGKTLWVGDLSMTPYGSHYCHQTMFLRIDVMRALNGFDLSYKISSDSDMVIRLQTAGYRGIHINYTYITYLIGGASGVNAQKVPIEHSRAFYTHIGKALGLTASECRDIWGRRFLDSYSIVRQLDTLRRIGSAFDTRELMETLLSRVPSIIPHSRATWREKIKRAGRMRSKIYEHNGHAYRTYYVLKNIPIWRKRVNQEIWSE